MRLRRAAAASFASLFGRAPEVAAEAPGRANLIGEHTDYNGGFVLPIAIPQRARTELARRPDRTVRVASVGEGRAPEIAEYVLGRESRRGSWIDYVQGIGSALCAEGCEIEGFEARIESGVPAGAGLGSSAALEVSLTRALRTAFALDLNDLQVARIGQRAENEFVGARVGIMDQMASSLANESSALFIDTRTLEFRHVPLPEGAELVVVHSGVTHDHARGDYNARRAECERACALLGVAALCDLSTADLPRLGVLSEPLARRARHVITENERVVAAVDALARRDLLCLGRLLDRSHASLRDDYEVSVPEVDLLVELARAEPAVYGARLTGGGFGGSVVMLVAERSGSSVAARVAGVYADRSGREPLVLVPVPLAELAA